MKGIFIYSALFLGMILYYYTMRLIYKMNHEETEKMTAEIVTNILGGSILVGVFIFLIIGFII